MYARSASLKEQQSQVSMRGKEQIQKSVNESICAKGGRSAHPVVCRRIGRFCTHTLNINTCSSCRWGRKNIQIKLKQKWEEYWCTSEGMGGMMDSYMAICCRWWRPNMWMWRMYIYLYKCNLWRARLALMPAVCTVGLCLQAHGVNRPRLSSIVKFLNLYKYDFAYKVKWLKLISN